MFSGTRKLINTLCIHQILPRLHPLLDALQSLQVIILVESLLKRMRYIPQPEAQEHYLAGAVGVVLEQAHGRITRMLQQADVFREITSYSWLPRVSWELPATEE